MDCSMPGFLVHQPTLSLLKFTSIESVMPSNCLNLCFPLLLPPSIFQHQGLSNESVHCIRWPKEHHVVGQLYVKKTQPINWPNKLIEKEIRSVVTTVFPGGSDGKASAYNVGNPGSISGSGRSPGEGNGNLLQYSCLENPMDGWAW